MIPDLPEGTHPYIVWAVVGAGALLILSSYLTKATGTLQQGWAGLVAGARKTHEDKDDADIRELKRQLDGVQAILTQVRAELIGVRQYQNIHDHILSDHLEWDRRAIQLAAEAGIVLPKPPPLWPDETSLPPSIEKGH